MTPLPQIETRPTEPSERLGAATSLLLAWATLALFNAITIAFQVPYHRGFLRQRIDHHVYDAGQMLAIGLASGAAVALWLRVRARLPLRLRAATLLDLGAVAVVALVLGFLTLGDDLANFADRLIQTHGAARFGAFVSPLLTVAVALVIPAAAGLGRLVARPWVRWLGVLGAASLGAANEVALQNDYRAVHLFLAWAAATLGASAIATLPLPRALLSRRART